MTKKTGRVVYMHLLDGQPAQYYKGQQIAFGHTIVTQFAESLQQIRREQKASAKWRIQRGFDGDKFATGHIRLNGQLQTPKTRT